MNLADYIHESNEHVKTLNHYQKHALLLALVDEVSVIIDDEFGKVIYELEADGLHEEIGEKPFSVMCKLATSEAIAWDKKYRDQPQLETVGKQKRGRKPTK